MIRTRADNSLLTTRGRRLAANDSLLTTNLAFSEWPKVFADDEKLTTALLDRLADRATVLTTRGKSFRMRRRQQNETAQPTAATGAPPLASLATADADEKPASRPGTKKR